MIEIQAYPSLDLAGERTQASRLEAGMVAAMPVVAIAVFWFADNGPLLRVAIAAIATLVGLFLYFRHPILYVQYALWVWFLAPLVRRIADLHFGWTEANVILLAPLLISGTGGLTLLRKNSRFASRSPAAFVLCGIAILYGSVVGVLLHPSAGTAYAFLNWLCPMLFGLHLYLDWPRYEQHKEAIGRTFLWAVLLAGSYGIYQFLDPPAWDCYWLENTRQGAPNSSFGRPEPLLVRVWSTVNAPGPFANTMVVGLLVLFGVRSKLKLPATVAGYTALLLTTVRSAWLGWVVGLLWILKSVSSRVLVRIILYGALLLVCLLPVVSQPYLATLIGNRLETFSDLQHDESIKARERMYSILTNDVLNDPFGQGVNNLEVTRGIALDSGLLSLAFSLGWLGSALFAAGMLSIFMQGRRTLDQHDQFLSMGKAAMLAILAQIVGGNVFVSVTGAMLWMLAGMCLAAHRYHEHVVTSRTAVAGLPGGAEV